MEIDNIKCSNCGCTGIHACLGSFEMDRMKEVLSEEYTEVPSGLSREEKREVLSGKPLMRGRDTTLTTDKHKQDLSDSGKLLAELISIGDNSPRISLKGFTIEEKKEELLTKIFKGIK